MSTEFSNRLHAALRSGSIDPQEGLRLVREANALPDGLRQLRDAWSRSPLPVIADYACLAWLGEGASGVVYRAVSLDDTPRLIALKVLRFGREEDRHRFVTREVEILRALDGPYVARFVAAGFSGGVCYLAMQQVDGTPLDEHVATMGPELAPRLTLFARVCDAVAEIHALGVVHRDLKPRHVIIRADGTPCIVDFGISAVRSDDWPTEIRRTQTQLGGIIGTVKYMSPEQAWGGLLKIDQKTDLWALGLMLHEIATGGGYPYDLGPTDERSAGDALLYRIQHERPHAPHIADKSLAPALTTLIARCLAHEPARRIESAAQLADDLRAALGHRRLKTRRLPLHYHARRILVGLAITARPALWLTALLAITVLIAGLAMVRGLRWYVSDQDLGVETRRALILANARHGEPDFLVIGISDQSAEQLPEAARRAGLTSVNANLFTWRPLHGHLMNRLAKTNARALIWDLYFRRPLPGDQALVQGARNLHQAGIPVALAARAYDQDGQPDISHTIREPLRGIACYGLITGQDPYLRPGQHVMATRRGDAIHPALVLSAFGALCHPHTTMDIAWSATERDLALRYRRPNSDEYLRALDELTLTATVTAGEAGMGLEAGDTVALKTFPLAPLDFWRGRTIPYEDLLALSDDELAALVNRRILIVADVRSPHPFLPRDLHRVRYDDAVLDGVPGGYLLADALRGLLLNRTARVETRLTAESYFQLLGMAVVGCLAAIPLASRTKRFPLPWRQGMVVGLLVSGLVCLGLMTSLRTRLGIDLTLCGASFCAAAAGALLIEFVRQRFRYTGQGNAMRLASSTHH